MEAVRTVSDELGYQIMGKYPKLFSRIEDDDVVVKKPKDMDKSIKRPGGIK